MAKNFRNASTGHFVTASAASRNTSGTLGEARGKDAPRASPTARPRPDASSRKRPLDATPARR